MRAFWFVLGMIFLALGLIGLVLPLLPTTVFILAAAFCFARSNEKWHNWLLNHPIFGPLILDWRDHGRIRRRAKWMATLMITLAFALSVLLGAPVWVLWLQVVILSAVLLFIWTRPDELNPR